MRDLKPGDVVAGLAVKERLGKGGMGDVFLARDESLAVDRALKIISLSGPGFTGSAAEAREYRQRFLREARTLAKLRHPNIIAVHATGEIDGNAYLVMTHFPSKDARHWLHDESPTLERIRHVALQAARALMHAHESGVLHRDIKLSNLLVGAGDEAMLIDFGLAKSRDDSDLTRTGRSMGTFSYLAPEYVKASMTGRPKHTVATDLWAFGCVLYALTCFRPAFKERDQLQLLRLIERVEFAPVKQVRPKVPDDWAKLVHELMEPDLARRLPSAAALVARLDGVSLATNEAPAAVTALPAVADEKVATADVGPAANHASVAQAALAAADVDAGEDESLDSDANADADAGGDIFETPKNRAPSEETALVPEAATPNTNVPQPSFQQPVENAAEAQRASAKRKLLAPLAAALAVLVVGGGLILSISTLGQRRQHSTTYVDPDDLARRQRGERELTDLESERETRGRRSAPGRDAAVPTPLVPMFAPTTSDDAPSPSPAQRPSSSKLTFGKRAPTPEHAAAATPDSSDPWRARYGSRTSFNTSSVPPAPPPATAAAASAIAGIKVPVRVADAIASAPIGPIIATVQQSTKLGTIELPRGSEIHGRITGAEGPRILVEFAFAIVDGKNVPLRGMALGTDGRAGVPGVKNFGGASDIGAGAAGGAARGLVDAAVSLVDNDIAKRTIAGAGAPAAAKSDRLNNDEQLVVAERGARFFVYVESAS